MGFAKRKNLSPVNYYDFSPLSVDILAREFYFAFRFLYLHVGIVKLGDEGVDLVYIEVTALGAVVHGDNHVGHNSVYVLLCHCTVYRIGAAYGD